MKRFTYILLTSTLLLFVYIIGNKLFAQGPPPPPPPPTSNIPIDGGISLLIAAGAAYGAKKVYDKRKNK